MYLLNDNSIYKSNVCISTKVNISTFKIYICVRQSGKRGHDSSAASKAAWPWADKWVWGYCDATKQVSRVHRRGVMAQLSFSLPALYAAVGAAKAEKYKTCQVRWRIRFGCCSWLGGAWRRVPLHHFLQSAKASKTSVRWVPPIALSHFREFRSQQKTY